MSMLPRTIDRLSAALRHIRDAERLAQQEHPDRSLDQAWHLAGYAPECAFKALLPAGAYDRLIGHRYLNPEVLHFVMALEPAASRLGPDRWDQRFPALRGWNESCRYARTGTAAEQEVRRLLEQVRALVDEVVITLWADGRLDPRGFPW